MRTLQIATILAATLALMPESLDAKSLHQSSTGKTLSQLQASSLYSDSPSESGESGTLTTLAEKSTSSNFNSITGVSTKSKKDTDPWGIGEFMLGVFMIPFALVLLWKNEKKVVTFAKCMEQGRDAVKSIDPEDPDDQNEFELVHLNGTTENAQQIIDNDFGIAASNSYRLKRKVEMYQWRETCTTENDRTVYRYDSVWSENCISSESFTEKMGHENPKNQWPFMSRTFEAQYVTLGKFRLRPDQILRLGHGATQKISLEEQGGDAAISHSQRAMNNASFAPFEARGIYLVSSASNNSDKAPHIGQYRVTFEYDLCGPATIIAQQVQNEEGQHTFRKWNPEKINVPYGQSTDAENQISQGNPMCCYICMCVDCCCEAMFEEVVDHAVDTKITSEAYFDAQQKNITTAAKIIRPSGIAMTCLGLFFLFSPVIALLKWIPLVGWLLGGAVTIAAAIFALVVGSVLSCLVIAIAWVFYRPLIGITLLVAVSIGLYFIFFFNKGEADMLLEEADAAQAADVPADPTVDPAVIDSDITVNPPVSPIH